VGKAHPTKFVWELFVLVLASRCFSSGATAIKIDRIPLFDVSRHRHRHGYGVIGRSMFDVHKFPFSIKLAVFKASGWAET